jgi:hypothetical protein
MSLIQCKRDFAHSRTPAHVPVKAVASSASGMPRFLSQNSSSDSKTGIPIYLKDRVETLSGVDLSDVRVHRNSSKPDRMNALAYTQGRDIHLGPGQEHHLPHEAWHAVQQKQGRVAPTTRAMGGAFNNYVGLESEADRMGNKAMSAEALPQRAARISEGPSSGQGVFQRKVKITGLTEEKRKAFLGKINASATGIQFQMNASGFLERVENAIIPTREYSKQLIAAIDDAQTVNLNLISQDDAVFIDSFASGKVDYDDMIGLEGDMFRNWLMHFVVERFAIADYETNKAGASSEDFRKAHEKGHEAQEKQLKAWYPTKTIKYVGEGLENSTKKVDASGNGTIEYHFDFTDVKHVFVQNVVNNAVKESIVSSKFVVVR